jgi:hypothetical protein
VRTPILLYAVALAVRALLIGLFPDPGYTDAAYYVDVARSIAAGHGLSVDFVWIFAELGNRIPPDPVLPVPSNGHWLPLASFVQVPFILLLGPTALASALPMALIGALAAPLTWLIARDAGARPAVAVGAGLLSAVPALATAFMAQPDNFAIFEPLVPAALWLTARSLKGSGLALAGAGLLAGLAALARNDGVLLAATIGVVWLADRLRWLRERGRTEATGGSRSGAPHPPVPVWPAVAAGALFLLVVAPWWARQLAVFGSISPTASNGAAMWLRAIEEWNSITVQPTMERFLAQGAGPILASRIEGLWNVAVIFTVFACAVVLLPLLVVGMLGRRRSPDFGPWFAYAIVVSLGAALLYPLHVPGGAYIHTAIGLLPHAYILILEGGEATLERLRRGVRLDDPGSRGGARPPQRDGGLGLLVGGIVGFSALAAVVFGGPLLREWDAVRQPRLALAAELDRLRVPRDDRLLGLDAASLHYWTGRPAVVTPNDPIDAIAAVASAYRVRWLVLERGPTARSSAVPALSPVLAGGPRPGWIGPPTFTFPAADGGVPRLALLPVCTEPGDERCPP